MMHIKSANYLQDKKLLVEFEEIQGKYVIAMSEYLNNTQFEILNELKLNNSAFRKFKIDHGVICWGEWI
jgi:hypothetical protein